MPDKQKPPMISLSQHKYFHFCCLRLVLVQTNTQSQLELSFSILFFLNLSSYPKLKPLLLTSPPNESL